MYGLKDLLENFFTHKSQLPPPDQWPGTLFSPLQIIFCAAVAIFIVLSAFSVAKKSEGYQKKVFFVLWLIMLISEPAIIWWEAAASGTNAIVPANDLPFWPCSIFLFTMPFAIFGKGDIRRAACGYTCTLGLLGGTINFVYPATYIASYSCISLAGLRTVFYHGSMVFCAIVMLKSGYHSLKEAKSKHDLLLPALPMLILSIPANIANYLIPEADYMFFRLNSFFFAPIGRATPDWLSMLMVYAIYLVIHSAPYLPAYIASKKAATEAEEAKEEAIELR